MIKLKDIYESLLLEKTFDIDEDVNYIYKRSGFEKFIKDFEDGKRPFEKNIAEREDITFEFIDSSELKNDDSKKAHNINPIVIRCGLYRINPNHYTPFMKYISLSFSCSALDVLYFGDVDDLPRIQQKTIVNEITEHRMKEVIYHELSHWISDSLYNKHVEKNLQHAKRIAADTMDARKAKDKVFKGDINASYIEIDAQVHAIKALKKVYKGDWDKLSMDDLFILYPSLSTILKIMYRRYGMSAVKKWQKELMKRMNREGLLGKNMRNFVT